MCLSHIIWTLWSDLICSPLVLSHCSNSPPCPGSMRLLFWNVKGLWQTFHPRSNDPASKSMLLGSPKMWKLSHGGSFRYITWWRRRTCLSRSDFISLSTDGRGGSSGLRAKFCSTPLRSVFLSIFLFFFFNSPRSGNPDLCGTVRTQLVCWCYHQPGRKIQNLGELALDLGLCAGHGYLWQYSSLLKEQGGTKTGQKQKHGGTERPYCELCTLICSHSAVYMAYEGVKIKRLTGRSVPTGNVKMPKCWTKAFENPNTCRIWHVYMHSRIRRHVTHFVTWDSNFLLSSKHPIPYRGEAYGISISRTLCSCCDYVASILFILFFLLFFFVVACK